MGALGKVGGEAAGWLMQTVGLDKVLGDDSAEIVTKLDELHADMQRIDDDITHLFIDKEFKDRVNAPALIALTNALDVLRDDEIHLADPTQDWANHPVQLQDNLDDMKKLIEDEILQHYDDIPNELRDGIRGDSLIKLKGYVISSQSGKRFFSNNDSLAVKAVFDYYDALQVMVLNYRLEYYHQAERTDMYKEVAKNYKDANADQMALLKEPIPVGTVIDKNRSVMWSVGTATHPPIWYTTYYGGLSYFYGNYNNSADPIWNNWQITEYQNGADELWYLFNEDTKPCVKGDNKYTTLTNLYNQGWPLWDWSLVDRIATTHFNTTNFVNEARPFNITNCNYDSADDANAGYYYDFMPYRYVTEGVGYYLYL